MRHAAPLLALRVGVVDVSVEKHLRMDARARTRPPSHTYVHGVKNIVVVGEAPEKKH